MTQLRRHSCCTTSCCTRGVAVAVSAISGTLGYLQSRKWENWIFAVTNDHCYSSVGAVHHDARLFDSMNAHRATTSMTVPALEDAEPPEVRPEVVACKKQHLLST